MSPYVVYDDAEDGGLLVEVTALPGEQVTRGGRAERVVAHAGETIQDSLRRVLPTLRDVVEQIRSTVDDGDQVELEFGLKFAADARVVIAGTSAEASLQIRLTLGGKGP
ncbi:MAG: CU044_2847 family protein [Actinophytocola sp.]|uniref:CU044_2847 family protein n=1 Tax=Actinophytocola sp. TaxID=1872138 RepID=UPI003D6AAF0C